MPGTVSSLVGRNVAVVGSDLIADNVVATIQLADETMAALLLSLTPAIQIAGKSYPYLVARPRLERDRVESLLKNGMLGCSITFVPIDRYDRSKPFDTSWWRGGAATIGDLKLVTI